MSLRRKTKLFEACTSVTRNFLPNNVSSSRINKVECPKSFCSVNPLIRGLATSSSSFTSVKCALLTQPGGTLHVEELKKEEKLHANQIRVQVDSAGVNNADVLMVRGLHHLKPQTPYVPGFELAGEVVEVGGKVKNFRIGDRVLGLKRVGTGAFAQLCVLDEDEAYSIPHSLNYETAVCLPVGYGTAYVAYQRIAKLKEKQSVLVLTSQGSTGIAAIDMALNVFKCKNVIAACDTEQKCAIVRPSGVLSTVEYTDENLPRNVLKATHGKGVDVIVDTVGGFWFDLALKCLKPEGYLCTVGFSSEQIPVVSLQDLIRFRANVSGIWLGGLVHDKPGDFHKIIQQLVEFRDEGFISPLVAQTFTLDRINDAIAAVDDKKSIGKIVLTLR